MGNANNCCKSKKKTSEIEGVAKKDGTKEDFRFN